MKIEEYEGDIFNSNAKIICHQTNCLGVMGGGIALQIRNRFPIVYEDYRLLCEQYRRNPKKLLGKIRYCPINNHQYIASIFGQCYYGHDKCYTDYKALKTAFTSMSTQITNMGWERIAFPKYFGCGLAGGDWNTVRDIILESFNNNDVTIEFWSLVSNNNGNNI